MYDFINANIKYFFKKKKIGPLTKTKVLKIRNRLKIFFLFYKLHIR